MGRHPPGATWQLPLLRHVTEMKSDIRIQLHIIDSKPPFNPLRQESDGSNVKMQTTKTFVFRVSSENPETKHNAPRKNPSINIFIVIVPDGKHTPGGLSNQDPLRVWHS